MAPTRNHRYVFVTRKDFEIEVWIDDRSLPSAVVGTDIRRARESPGEMHRCGNTGIYLGYMPVKGR